MPEAQPVDPLSVRPKESRRAIAVIASIGIGTFLVGLLLLSLFLNGFLFGSGSREYTNLTFRKYASLESTDDFAPIGGEHINFKNYSSRDSSDQWWSMTISETDYRKLVDAEQGRVVTEAEGPYKRDPMTATMELPGRWPLPQATTPGWWKPPVRGSELEGVRWEIQRPDRGIGRYWVYDRATSTLWIWRWDHQWFHFPETSSERQATPLRR